MSKIILVIGRSGSGKSTSLRSFKPNDIFYVNVLNKDLPFRGRFNDTFIGDDSVKIANAVKRTEKKVTVIDDANYLITNFFMRGHSDRADIYGFYNTLADNFWNLIRYCASFEAWKTVYFFMHEETDNFGNIKPKTIGKLLDDKVCIEGMFTIVLRSMFEGGRYIFRTQTDGTDVVKTPIGMFDAAEIDNDLKMVDATIRQYYGMEGEKK